MFVAKLWFASLVSELSLLRVPVGVKMLTRKQVDEIVKKASKDKRWTERVTIMLCPICRETGIDFYPYAHFTIKHEHPVRRYWYFLTTGRIYSKWLKEYWTDVEKYTGKTRKDYAVP